MQLVQDFDRIATGLIYQDTDAKDFLSLQSHRDSISTTPRDETDTLDISSLLTALMV